MFKNLTNEIDINTDTNTDTGNKIDNFLKSQMFIFCQMSSKPIDGNT
jgi:hypothetical protein